MLQKADTAAICGLFCGTCPSYPAQCEGCLSEKVAADCASCSNGFRDCAALHKVTRCGECGEFPCERLEAFSKKHIVNGICHHAHVIDNLYEMRQIGAEAWAEKQLRENTCPACGELTPWYERECPRCKA